MNFRVTALSFVVLLAATSFGNSLDVEGLLGKMRDAYKGTKSAQVEVKLELKSDGEETLNATASVTFASPKRAKVVFRPEGEGAPPPLTYIQDGKKMQATVSEDQKMTREYDEDEFPLPLNLETLSFWQWEKQLSTAEGANMKNSELKVVEDVEWNGKKWITLEETVKKDDVFIRYYVDPNTFLIWRCEIKDLESMVTRLDVTVTEMKTGIEVDESMFAISD